MSTTYRLLTRFALIVVVTLALFSAANVSPVFAACAITGTVYRDYDNNGVQGIREIGEENIVVNAYYTGGAPIATTTTLADGTYALPPIPAATVPDGDQVRVEFVIPAALNFLRSGPFGAASGTMVQFIDCTGAPVVNLGVSNPDQYCSPDPLLTTSCFVFGDQTLGANANDTVLVSLPYSAGDVPGGGAYDLTPGVDEFIEAQANQIGSVWGLAYQRSTDTVFAAPLVRRHAGLGAGGAGTIYSIANISDPINPPTITPLVNYGAAAGTRDVPADWLNDSIGYSQVGRVGWGDADMSSDDTTLFAVNLFDNSVYAIPVADPTNETVRAVPNIPGCAGGDTKPWALKFHDGALYVGAVCTAMSTQNINQLTAAVFRFNPTSFTFNPTPVFSFPLTYERGCLNAGPNCAGAGALATVAGTPFNQFAEGEWLPWIPYTTNAALGFPQPIPYPFDANGTVAYPQPILADIEFDGRDMIFSFIDRFGYQQADTMGRSPLTPTAPFRLNSARTGGDLLRACWNGVGWTLENNGSCGGVTTNYYVGAPPYNVSQQGPGTSEYYFADTWNMNGTSSHEEINVGGLLQIPGYEDVVFAAFDPIPQDTFDGGLRWARNVTNTGGFNPGEISKIVRIYTQPNGQAPPAFPSMGKGNGLGDLEGMCGPAPLEIGNRVWEDLDRNGLQDPNEVVFANVILSLYIDTNADNIADTFVANTTTNLQGEYIFSGATIDAYLIANAIAPVAGIHYFEISQPGRQTNEPFGIMPNRAYEVRIEDPANFGAGDPLENYFATAVNMQADMRDSDGRVTAPALFVGTTNVPRIALTTSNFGNNDHTFDFGFSQLVPPTPTPPPTPGTGLVPPSPSTPPPIVSKQVSPPFAGPGDTVTWTVSVNNPGATPVNNITLVDDFPPGLEIKNVTTTVGTTTIGGQSVLWFIPSLAAGATVTMTIETEVRIGTPIPFILTNTAYILGVPFPPGFSPGLGSGPPGSGALGSPSGYGQGEGFAQASLVSAGTLPDTGQAPLLILIGVTSVMAILWIFMSRR